ncbi:hypothetical protein H1S01_03345 [Heliobacterium chlorum]|uniref:Uncharacterized protein n=1 Tax=Heliobacterium chlorum TaxID=2698 RepID=A0ABR7T0B9_HELCL|nr:hypothetical protein [Heliobacterium chlorum]MBC9783547.1 hypothetical protein [Heliobacterium chlorum]
MDNTMTTIAKYIQGRYADFGLASTSDLKLIGKSKASWNPGSKWLIMTTMRPMPDTKKAPFGNLLDQGVRGERWMVQVELECKMRAANPSVDFYWNLPRQFGDKVRKALAGLTGTGILILRYDWTNPTSPTRAGEIKFEVIEGKSPLLDEVEDPNDAANKSIFLTYQVRWWSPMN